MKTQILNTKEGKKFGLSWLGFYLVEVQAVIRK